MFACVSLLMQAHAPLRKQVTYESCTTGSGLLGRAKLLATLLELVCCNFVPSACSVRMRLHELETRRVACLLTDRIGGDAGGGGGASAVAAMRMSGGCTTLDEAADATEAPPSAIAGGDGCSDGCCR